jgi:YVTN family beta-propeller protein
MASFAQTPRAGTTVWPTLVVGLAMLALASCGTRALPGAAPAALATSMTTSNGAGLPLQTIADISLPGGASRFDYESIDQERKRLFIAHLGASTVTIIDTGANRVVANIPGIADVHGVLAVPSLHRVYASATGDNQIAVIDEDTLHVLARVPGGVYPDGMAYDADRQLLFVSDESGGTDTVIDTKTNQRVATISLGGEAGNTQYDPISHRVFVAVQTRNQLVAIDPLRRQVVAQFALPGCQHDHGLLLDTPQHLAFVACDGNATLLVVDLRSMQVLSTQTVGAVPDVLALDAVEHRLYVAAESGVVSVFTEGDRTVRKLGEGFVAPDAHVVAVDDATHILYLPLQNVGGAPVLRISRFGGPK